MIASDAVVLEVGALPQVGVATLIAGQASASTTPASTSVVAVLGQAERAEPPSLPQWALIWDDELLERIPSTSATNIEAGLRDRVRELRGSRREAGLARHLKVGYWTISVPFIDG